MPLNDSGTVALAFLLVAFGGSEGHAGTPFMAAAPAGGQRVGPTPMAPDSPRAVVPASTLDQEAPPADLPQSTGPRGTSGQEQRYDTVGYAGSFDGGGAAAGSVSVAHATLPVGSYVELTALDTGRTIIALVATQGSGGRIVDLSPAAAQQLGVGEGAPVRVRLVTPSPQDQNALRSGHTASARMDAPQSLLTALRRKLPARMAPVPVRASAPPVPARPARTVAPPPGARYSPPSPEPAKTAPSRSGYLVQVAAFSTRERAQTAARQVGGRIAPAGALFRVQIGPFADAASAKRARDEAARHGYADARILHIE
ncbi:MAG: SPOR domain-containing protein [Candidatus Sphingomonas phytovorans]|nr:SPOR domain-containing protein [Sphingomonas sp.]WEK01287.1 MAG: SPOR domain-containing protein [Sphingomonas sp.]